MEPTLNENEIALVSRISYWFGKPKVGDIIVLRRETYIIKRIKKINLSVDGERFFVEGDNKSSSTDSRNFGWISKKEILGKVILKI